MMKVTYIGVEMSSAERERQTRQACGTNEKVVQQAAA